MKALERNVPVDQTNAKIGYKANKKNFNNLFSKVAFLEIIVT